MIEAVEHVSFVLWAVAAVAAGMYPLGLLLPCSPCCGSECESPFHRCLRAIPVNGRRPVFPRLSREIMSLAEAGIRKASTFVTVEVDVTLHGYDGPLVTETATLLYRSSWSGCTEASPQQHQITFTILPRDTTKTLAEDNAAREAAIAAKTVITKTGDATYTIKAFAGLTKTRITLDIPLSGACRIPGGVVEVQQPGNVYVYPAAWQHPLDTYVVHVDERVSPWRLYEYDPSVVQQFRTGDVTLRGAERISTDWSSVDFRIVDATPLCGMSLCNIPAELAPSGVTFTPSGNVKWNCQTPTDLVLGRSPGACEYSHTTHNCYGDYKVSIALEEFIPWTLDPGSPVPSAADVLSWLDAAPRVVDKNEGSYAVGGTYNPGRHRNGYCWQPSADKTVFFRGYDDKCPPKEVTFSVGKPVMGGVSLCVFGQPSGGAVYQPVDLSAAEGDYVVPLSKSTNGCGANSYEANFEIKGTAENPDDPNSTVTTEQVVATISFRYVREPVAYAFSAAGPCSPASASFLEIRMRVYPQEPGAPSLDANPLLKPYTLGTGRSGVVFNQTGVYQKWCAGMTVPSISMPDDGEPVPGCAMTFSPTDVTAGGGEIPPLPILYDEDYPNGAPEELAPYAVVAHGNKNCGAQVFYSSGVMGTYPPWNDQRRSVFPQRLDTTICPAEQGVPVEFLAVSDGSPAQPITVRFGCMLCDRLVVARRGVQENVGQEFENIDHRAAADGNGVDLSTRYSVFNNRYGLVWDSPVTICYAVVPGDDGCQWRASASVSWLQLKVAGRGPQDGQNYVTGVGIEQLEVTTSQTAIGQSGTVSVEVESPNSIGPVVLSFTVGFR